MNALTPQMSTPRDSEQSTGPPSSKRPAPRGTASYPRKRAVKACQVCRARRTKCDNLKPTCSFCLKTGAVCIQSPTDLSSFDPASLRILEQLDVVENLVRSIPNHPHSYTSLESPQQSVLGAPPLSLTTLIQPSSVLPERLEDSLDWSVFGSAEKVSRSKLDNHHASYTSVTDSHTPAALTALLEDAPQTVNKLVEAFFGYVHVKNPILDEVATRRLVSSTNINGIDWSLNSCLYLLICALGSIATPFGPSDCTLPCTVAYTNAQAFFNAAEKRLGFSIGSGGMLAAQCLFLSGVYMMSIFQPKKAWRFFLQAVAACQDFSFLSHAAKTSSAEEMPCDEADYRKYTLQQAVYWSAWKSEREVRAELDLPDFSLADEDRGFYPSFFPTPPLQEMLSQNAGSDVKHEATAWYFYLAEISLRRLSSRICAEIISLSRVHLGSDFLASAALAVPTWETEAQQWVDSLPAPLSFNTAPYEDDVCRFVLRGHLINLYELIYWPFVCAVLGIGGAASSLEHEFHGGLPPAFVTQMARKGLKTHMQRIEVNEPGFRHRHHGTWPMARTCTRSALVLVASAAILHDRDNDSVIMEPPFGWQQRVSSVMALLAHWETEMPDLGKAHKVLEDAIERMTVRDTQEGTIWRGS